MAQFPKMSRKKALTIASACMLSFLPALAQDDEEDLDLGALFDLKLETGSFLELERSKSPVTMTIIDTKMVKNSAARNLTELLEIYVPGFQYMVNKWNGDIWGMRGVASDRNNKIIVMINGKKQNLQNFHGFSTETQLGILGDIERIEVLRGPAGLVYGSGAIAGVVNIVTREVKDNAVYGSAFTEITESNGIGSFTVEGGVSQKFNENNKLAVHGGFKRANGLGDGIHRIYGVPEMHEPTKEKPYIKAADGTQRTLPYGKPGGSYGKTDANYVFSADYSFHDLNLYSRFSRQSIDVGAYFLNYDNIDAWRADRRNHLRDNITLGGDYGVDIGEDRLSFDLSHVAASNQLAVRQFTDDKGILRPGGIAGSTGERRTELTVKYLMKRVEKLQLAAGYQYGFHKIGYDLNDDLNPNAWWGPNKETKYDNNAFFGEAFYEFNDVFAVEAGARFDKHTMTDGVISPKAALIVSPSKDHTIKFIVQSSSNNADALTYSSIPEGGASTWTYEKYNQYGSGDAIYEYTTVGSDGKDSTAYTTDASLADTLPSGDIKTRLGNIQAPAASDIKPEKSFSLELTTSHNWGTFNVSPSVSYNRMSQLYFWNGTEKQTQEAKEYQILAVELEISKKWDKLSLGGNASYGIPLNLDTAAIEYSRPLYTPKYDAAQGGWVPEAMKDASGKVLNYESSSYLLKDQISSNGKYFNRMHTVTAKIFADYEPSEFVTFHNNLRMFFGLWGREELDAKYESQNGAAYDNLGITDKTPMVKWNSAINFHLPKSWDVSVIGYNLLGNDHNEHAARWQQMTAPSQDDYFTVDQRTYGFKVTKGF